jgi:myo-inositol 2-dehydrogenase/D-chiro-inositol 1-dehydrogenase
VTVAGDRLAIGLVGCGMIGQVHADGLRKLAQDGEIVAVAAADPSAEAREAVQRNCPFGRMSDDPLDVISDPAVEAVMITAPTATHLDLVRATLAAGKPLFCEKPLAPTFDDVRAICDAVTASGLTAQVGFHSRFHPIMNRLRRTVQSGELGRPMGYTLRDDQYWPTGDVVPGHSSWRSDRAQAGGGALLEHSIHSADIVSWLFGPAVRVYARIRSVFGYDVEDVAAVTVEHESGVVGTILTIFNAVRGREERRFEVFFERGAVEATTDFIVGAEEDSYLVQQPDTPAQRPDLAKMREEHFAALGIDRRDFVFYTYPADRNWASAVRHGETAVPGFDDALRAHRLVEAAYRSAAGTVAVDIGDDFR